MTDVIAHRGPDDAGIVVDETAGLALGFRRLAIIDLTPLGHQPMTSPSGRFVIVFNGEIYNHRALRLRLEREGVSFRGRSDTEVICAALEQWGGAETFAALHGMFAIAAWDTRERRLLLARDRIGIKPLYVQWAAGTVAFASELKSLARGPHAPASLDAEAAREFLSLLYVPGPRTIFRDVMKLPPGSWVEIRDPAQSPPEPRRFWDVQEVARAGRPAGNTVDDSRAAGLVETVLQEAVASHLESDVPLGAFLSGGIDSSTVVALMQRSSAQPVRTFTVRFDDPRHDEADHAEAVARHLGTDHETLPVTGDDALELVPRLAEIYDEPFADSSQLPSLLVAAAARRHVTVVLTGDGGDEVFGGYNRYLYGRRTERLAERMPRAVRLAAARLIGLAPAGSIDRAGALPFPPFSGLRLPEQKARKLARLLPLERPVDRYWSLVSTGVEDAPSAVPKALRLGFALPERASLLDRMLLADQLGYLPDNQMTKVDRATMAVSLEARVPLLDHRVVELAWQLPEHWLVRDGLGKIALRHVLDRHVPRALIDRPKTGFSVPLAGWLRGPLRAWAEPLFRDADARNGPLAATEAGAHWDRLLRGHDDAAPAVWTIATFEAWRRRWLP